MTADRTPPKYLEDYVPVSVRVEKFYEQHPEGRILTEIISIDDKRVVVKARVYRDFSSTLESSTGHAEEVRAENYVNESSALENAETSAVGRALALLGYEVKKGLASREEMNKVDRANQARETREDVGTEKARPDSPPATPPSPVPSRAPTRNTESQLLVKPGEKCEKCGKALDSPPHIARWVDAKRKNEPEFPSICPGCFNKGQQKSA